MRIFRPSFYAAVCGLVCAFSILDTSLKGVLAQEVAAKPVLKIEKSEFDFGTAIQGTSVTHEFQVKNEGSADLVIQRVVASCGCTAAVPPNGAIAPGAQGTISVSFDTSGFEGKVEKVIRVFSNDTNNPTPILYLKGVIDSQVTLNPSRIRFDEISQGASVEPREVKVDIKEGAPLSIQSIDGFSNNLEIKVTDKKAKHASFVVGLSKNISNGPIRERVVVTVKDSGGKEHSFNLPVVGSVVGPVEVQPKVLSLGIIEGTEPIVRNVKISSRGKEPLAISAVSSDSTALAVEVKAGKKEGTYVLAVSVDPKKVSSDIKTAIRIKTDSKVQPEVVLDVYGIVPTER